MVNLDDTSPLCLPAADLSGATHSLLMPLDKRSLLVECVTAVSAVLLWQTTFHLLGLPAPMSPGLKTGSIIVFAGCFVLCRGLVSAFFQIFLPPPISGDETSRRRLPGPATPDVESEAHVRRPSALYRSKLPRLRGDN